MLQPGEDRVLSVYSLKRSSKFFRNEKDVSNVDQSVSPTGRVIGSRAPEALQWARLQLWDWIRRAVDSNEAFAFQMQNDFLSGFLG
jgi:hypothetical protein